MLHINNTTSTWNETNIVIIHIFIDLWNFFSTLSVWAMLKHGSSLNTIYNFSGSSFLFSERNRELLYSASFQTHF